MIQVFFFLTRSHLPGPNNYALYRLIDIEIKNFQRTKTYPRAIGASKVDICF